MTSICMLRGKSRIEGAKEFTGRKSAESGRPVSLPAKQTAVSSAGGTRFVVQGAGLPVGEINWRQFRIAGLE